MKIRYCQNCDSPIEKTLHTSRRGYALRKYCSAYCGQYHRMRLNVVPSNKAMQKDARARAESFYKYYRARYAFVSELDRQDMQTSRAGAG